MRFISLQADQRYVPVYRRGLPAGIIILADNDPSAPEDVAKGRFNINYDYSQYSIFMMFSLILVERLALGQEEEAPAPEAFIWDPNDP